MNIEQTARELRDERGRFVAGFLGAALLGLACGLTVTAWLHSTGAI